MNPTDILGLTLIFIAGAISGVTLSMLMRWSD